MRKKLRVFYDFGLGTGTAAPKQNVPQKRTRHRRRASTAEQH